jgi:hypothetical protein
MNEIKSKVEVENQLVTLIAFKPKNKILELNGQFKNS